MAGRRGEQDPHDGRLAADDVEPLAWSRRGRRSGRGGTTRRRSARRPRPGRRPRPARAGRSRGRPAASNQSSWWRTSEPACRATTSQPPGASGRVSAASASGSSDAARWIREYHASTADQPRAVGRPHQPAQVADLVAAVREAAPRLRDHARRQVDAGGVGAGLGEVRRDVARARSRPRPPGRRRRARRPGRAASARTAAGRAARRPAGRRTPAATASYDERTRSSRASPPAASTDSRSTAGPAAGAASSLTATSPSRCTQRLSCWPRWRGSSRTSGSGRAARPARHDLDRARGRRSRAADRCGSAARRAPAGRAAAGP